MYTDLITPKSYPDRLQEVSYDFFGLMPATLPAHPRVLATAAEIARAKERITRVPWAKAALALLLEHCAGVGEIPDELPVPADGTLSNSVLYYIERHALAFLLTGGEKFREVAVANMRKLARAYPQWTITGGGGRATGNSLGESHYTHHLGRAFDLLAAGGLEADDDAAFRALLTTAYEVSDLPSQSTCSNHNTWRLCGRLAVSSALGDLQGIHDALYGFAREGVWRYGLIHQLRHDIFPDGLHWERTLGYHYYTLMGLTEMADMLMHLGVDIWHVELPMQRQDDGEDLHRVYATKGEKSLKVAYDAPFYMAYPNADTPLLHDSGLLNLRGAAIWGPVYDLAYEAYGDEKYAWLLNRIEREVTDREHPELPMSLQTTMGDLDFVRLADESYPEGRFSHVPDAHFAPLARHEGGCTLFPCYGGAVLRADPADEAAPSAYLFFGPHSAGHQSPAALHLGVHAGGADVATGPEVGGYEDPDYLTWMRTTIAQNTVTVDEAPMFPYDFPTESIWECDHWRDRVSDGELLLFQPGDAFHAMRAANENVYPGVRLDRTVVLTRGYLLDAYRVTGDVEHRYDWAMHCQGIRQHLPADAFQPLDLGANRGYNHLREGYTLAPADHFAFDWTLNGHPVNLRLLTPPETTLTIACDPDHYNRGYGAGFDMGPRTALIARTNGKDALFLALWLFQPADQLNVKLLQGDARSDLAVEVQNAIWHLPYQTGPIVLDNRLAGL